MREESENEEFNELSRSLVSQERASIANGTFDFGDFLADLWIGLNFLGGKARRGFCSGVVAAKFTIFKIGFCD